MSSSSKKRSTTASRSRPGATRTPTANRGNGGRQAASRPARNKVAGRGQPAARGGASRTSGGVTWGGPSRAEVVVGQVPAVARVAGGLAVLAAVCGVLAPMFPMVTERTPTGGNGGDVGGAANVFDLVPPLAAAVVLVTAGVLVLRGRLPRFGLATIGVYGAGSIGLLMQTIYLYDTANRSSRDLPLPIAMVRTFRYDPATGLHLRLLAGILAVAALVTVALAWSRTWVEDDGGFDLLRPLFGGLALLPGFLAMAGVGLAAGVSDVALNGPQSILRRDGIDLVGTIALALVLLGGAVLAPSIRPRQATVGVFAGLAALTGAEALRNGLLVARADTLSVGLGGILMVLSTVLFPALAVAAWYMSRQPEPADEDR